jgi:hypothetical protein
MGVHVNLDANDEGPLTFVARCADFSGCEMLTFVSAPTQIC